MPRRYYSNVANPVYLVGTLDGSSTTNTISVSTEVGGTTTTPPGWPTSYPYFAAIDPDTGSEEIVSVTAGTGGTLTITRGTAIGALGFGTSTKAHQSGAQVAHVVTAADYDEANLHVNSTQAVHGLATGSSVVGTTDNQTLTNKTLGSTVTVTGGGQVVSTTAAQTLTNKTLTTPTLTSGGAVVGTTEAQTLTNKTLTAPAITGGTVDGAGIVSLTAPQVLTNKTLTSPTITGTGAIAAATVTATGAVSGSTLSASGTVAGSNLPATVDLTSAGVPLTYSPNLSATTTPPNVGVTANREGIYITIGKLVYVNIRIQLGTSPSPGAGIYSITLPVPFGTATLGGLSGYFLGSTTTGRVPVSGYINSSTTVRILMPIYNATGPTYGQQWQSGQPFAVGSGGTPSLVAGDEIVLYGTYLRA